MADKENVEKKSAKAKETVDETIAETIEETVEVTTPQFEEVEIADAEIEINEPKSKEEPTYAGASETVTIQPVQFASFEDLSQAQGETNKNLDILMDIKLQLTVELGRTELPIKKVLELTRGSIIELQKVAGEPVELYANGKLVAHGEVVVIEDNFGLRITSITDPEERLKGLKD